MGVGHVPQKPIRPVTAAARTARGKWAEDLATRWYVHHGYQIIARNWRCPRGELDVVAMIGDELVVCEVKARANVAFGTPAEAITSNKQLRLRRATAALLAELRANKSRNVRRVRFDVACVLGSRLEIVMDAF